MSALTHTDSITVAATPEQVYDMVSDVTRMGEWSPICKACWWVEGDGPAVGAVFAGRNELPERTWETRSTVIAADRGARFAFEVGNKFVRWTYRFAPAADGTELTEEWEFLPDGIAMFHERYGDDAEQQIALRTKHAREGIPVTLAAIKESAESRG